MVTGAARGQNHGQAHIGDGAVTDHRRIPLSPLLFHAPGSLPFLISAVFPVVVHPAFTRFPNCFCHTSVRELIPLYNLIQLLAFSPMRHPFLSFPYPLPPHTLYTLSLKLLVYPLIRRITYITLLFLSAPRATIANWADTSWHMNTHERRYMVHMPIYFCSMIVYADNTESTE